MQKHFFTDRFTREPNRSSYAKSVRQSTAGWSTSECTPRRCTSSLMFRLIAINAANHSKIVTVSRWEKKHKFSLLVEKSDFSVCELGLKRRYLCAWLKCVTLCLQAKSIKSFQQVRGLLLSIRLEVLELLKSNFGIIIGTTFSFSRFTNAATAARSVSGANSAPSRPSRERPSTFTSSSTRVLNPSR